MQMLRSTILSQGPSRQIKPTNPSYDNKTPGQQNKSFTNPLYKSHFQRYPHGIGLSLKTTQNRQIRNKPVGTSNNQQHLDDYVQKVIKSNLERISQLRTEHQKQKEELFHEIKTLKTENALLKVKIQEQGYEISRNQFQSNKQLPHSLQKNIHQRLSSQKTLELNPQKLYESKVLMDEMKEKNEKLTKQIEQYRKWHVIVSIQKRNINSNLQRVQKQSYEKTLQLQRLKKLSQQYLKSYQNSVKQLNQVKIQNQTLKKDNEVLRTNLEKEIEKLKNQKELKKQKPSNQNLSSQQNSIKQVRQHRNSINFIDKRHVKQLELQLREKDAQIFEKDRLINDLNEKIMGNGLIGLHTKYKYLMKA